MIQTKIYCAIVNILKLLLSHLATFSMILVGNCVPNIYPTNLRCDAVSLKGPLRMVEFAINLRGLSLNEELLNASTYSHADPSRWTIPLNEQT